MSVILELLLGTGAVLGAAVAGATIGLAVALFLPRCLFVSGQIIFGIKQRDTASGFVYPPEWYRKATVALPVLVAPVPTIVLVILLLVVYPPARIPSLVLLPVVIGLMVIWVGKSRRQRKQEQERVEQEQVEALKEGKRTWRKEHGLSP
jgi:hypothetical protein